LPPQDHNFPERGAYDEAVERAYQEHSDGIIRRHEAFLERVRAGEIVFDDDAQEMNLLPFEIAEVASATKSTFAWEDDADVGFDDFDGCTMVGIEDAIRNGVYDEFIYEP